MKIDSMDSCSLEAYLRSVHQATLPQMDKNDLIVACEDRLARLDRSVAMVEETDLSDFGGM